MKGFRSSSIPIGGSVLLWRRLWQSSRDSAGESAEFV
jgi:hypothetical protein